MGVPKVRGSEAELRSQPEPIVSHFEIKRFADWSMSYEP
jgi:hypothetical protein